MRWPRPSRGDESPTTSIACLRVDAETQLPDDLLMLTDKMSMAVSLECRVPLLDHELVELAARIPHDVKIRGGRLKHLMKAALSRVLPDDILHRKKRGFGTPMGAWLKRESRAAAARPAGGGHGRARGLFRPRAIARLSRTTKPTAATAPTAAGADEPGNLEPRLPGWARSGRRRR